MNIAAANNMIKSKINMGMFSSMLILVVFESLFYPFVIFNLLIKTKFGGERL